MGCVGYDYSEEGIREIRGRGMEGSLQYKVDTSNVTKILVGEETNFTVILMG